MLLSNKMKTTLLILTLVTALLGCNEKNEISKEMAFAEIGKGHLSGNGDEGIEKSNLVIKTKTDWETLMQKMNTSGNVTDNFTETDIDFNTYMVIAVFLEVKSSGWQVEITKITENRTNLVIDTNEIESINTVITQPFHIVKIVKTEKQIIFNLELTE